LFLARQNTRNQFVKRGRGTRIDDRTTAQIIEINSSAQNALIKGATKIKAHG